jgi:uncharacterized SAM-binding protein YcdF (DUF218 family)
MYQVLVWSLLQPFAFFYLLAGVGLVLLWRKRRETRRRLLWVSVSFAVLTVLCLPPVGYLALGSLEWQNPPLSERPADAQAIVVLASYVYPADAVRPRAELDEDTLNRCLKAAEVYRQGKPCPVVVTGGKTDPDPASPPAALVMRQFLLQLGVSGTDLVVEPNSGTTYENAVESRKLLDERQVHKIVLVTDATHLARAAGCFRKQGFEVVPCGCQYRATKFEWTVADFLPNPAAAQHCQSACHEWLGTFWYWLRGRL